MENNKPVRVDCEGGDLSHVNQIIELEAEKPRRIMIEVKVKDMSLLGGEDDGSISLSNTPDNREDGGSTSLSNVPNDREDDESTPLSNTPDACEEDQSSQLSNVPTAREDDGSTTLSNVPEVCEEGGSTSLSNTPETREGDGSTQLSNTPEDREENESTHLTNTPEDREESGSTPLSNTPEDRGNDGSTTLSNVPDVSTIDHVWPTPREYVPEPKDRLANLSDDWEDTNFSFKKLLGQSVPQSDEPPLRQHFYKYGPPPSVLPVPSAPPSPDKQVSEESTISPEKGMETKENPLATPPSRIAEALELERQLIRSYNRLDPSKIKTYL